MFKPAALTWKAPLSIALIGIIMFSTPPLNGAPNVADTKPDNNTITFADTDGICGPTPQSSQLARLIINDDQQQHPQLRCNTLLTSIAQSKAQEMADNQLLTHFGQGGANRRLRDAGYRLPSNYPGLFGNQVESVAGGFKTPEKTWQELKASQNHRAHLLGERAFFRQQNEIGVGFVHAPDSAHTYYWVIYIASQEDS